MEAKILEWVIQLGWPAALVIFFIWTNWHEKRGLMERLDTLEDRQVNMLDGLIRECTTCIKDNTAAMTRLTDRLDQLDRD